MDGVMASSRNLNFQLYKLDRSSASTYKFGLLAAFLSLSKLLIESGENSIVITLHLSVVQFCAKLHLKISKNEKKKNVSFWDVDRKESGLATSNDANKIRNKNFSEETTKTELS